ncbi:hypothetical protein GTW50_18375 [Streptomyces sp. SID7815]|uniref:hypothetical protein n=1 Tax=Streptomyces sp. SID7815 TaxID=2690332 RepID=UPI001319D6B4|nr:hypothetical protein [Streptomyces sp. SID7815]MYT52456.1 hypothetical protein [Streptomyces sp. SID7815]
MSVDTLRPICCSLQGFQESTLIGAPHISIIKVFTQLALQGGKKSRSIGTVCHPGCHEEGQHICVWRRVQGEVSHQGSFASPCGS